MSVAAEPRARHTHLCLLVFVGLAGQVASAGTEQHPEAQNSTSRNENSGYSKVPESVLSHRIWPTASPLFYLSGGFPEHYGASGLPFGGKVSSAFNQGTKGEKLFTILRAAVLLRDNLASVFGFFLHQPDNTLGTELYSALKILHDLVRLRRIQMATLVGVLPEISEMAPSAQFLILFRRMTHVVPRYARGAVDVWVSDLQKDLINVHSLMKTPDGAFIIDILAGFDRVTMNQLNSVKLKLDQSTESEFTFMRKGDILDEVLEGLQEKSIKLTQPLFALIVSYRSRNIILPDKEESERYLIQVLSRNEVDEWDRTIKMLKQNDYKSPGELIRSVLRQVIKLRFVNQITKRVVQEVLDYIQEPNPTFLNQHYAVLSPIMSEPSLNLLKLLDLIVVGQYPQEIVDLKYKVQYYIRSGLLAIEASNVGFSRFDHVSPINLLIAILSRIQLFFTHLPHEIMSAVINLKLYLNHKVHVLNMRPIFKSDVENMLLTYDSYHVPDAVVALSSKLRVHFSSENIDWKKITTNIERDACGDLRTCARSILQESMKQNILNESVSKPLVLQLLNRLHENGNPRGLWNDVEMLCSCEKEGIRTENMRFARQKKMRNKKRQNLCVGSDCAEGSTSSVLEKFSKGITRNENLEKSPYPSEEIIIMQGGFDSILSDSKESPLIVKKSDRKQHMKSRNVNIKLQSTTTPTRQSTHRYGRQNTFVIHNTNHIRKDEVQSIAHSTKQQDNFVHQTTPSKVHNENNFRLKSKRSGNVKKRRIYSLLPGINEAQKNEYLNKRTKREAESEDDFTTTKQHGTTTTKKPTQKSDKTYTTILQTNYTKSRTHSTTRKSKSASTASSTSKVQGTFTTSSDGNASSRKSSYVSSETTKYTVPTVSGIHKNNSTTLKSKSSTTKGKKKAVASKTTVTYKSSNSKHSSLPHKSTYSQTVSTSQKSISSPKPTVSVTETNVTISHNISVPVTLANGTDSSITVSIPQVSVTIPLSNVTASVADANTTVSKSETSTTQTNATVHQTNVTVSITTINDTKSTTLDSTTSSTYTPLTTLGNVTQTATVNDTYEEFTEEPVTERNITVETKGRYKIITNEWTEKLKTHKRHHVHGFRPKNHAPPPHPTHISHTTRSRHTGKTDSHHTLHTEHMKVHDDHLDTTSKPMVVFESPVQYANGHRPVRYRIVKFKRLKHSRGKRIRHHKQRKVPKYKYYPKSRPDIYHLPAKPGVYYPQVIPKKHYPQIRQGRYQIDPHQQRWSMRIMNDPYASMEKLSKEHQMTRRTPKLDTYPKLTETNSARRKIDYDFDTHDGSEYYENDNLSDGNDEYYAEDHDDSHEPQEHFYDSHEEDSHQYSESDEDLSEPNERNLGFEENAEDNLYVFNKGNYHSEGPPRHYDNDNNQYVNYKAPGRKRNQYIEEYYLEQCDVSSEECDSVYSQEFSPSEQHPGGVSSEEYSHEEDDILLRSAVNDSDTQNTSKLSMNEKKLSQLLHHHSQHSRKLNSKTLHKGLKRRKKLNPKDLKILLRKMKSDIDNSNRGDLEFNSYGFKSENVSTLDSNYGRKESSWNRKKRTFNKIGKKFKRFGSKLRSRGRDRSWDRGHSRDSAVYDQRDKDVHILQREYKDLLADLSSSEELLLFESGENDDLDYHYDSKKYKDMHGYRDDVHKDKYDYHFEKDFDNDRDYDYNEDEDNSDYESGEECIDGDCNLSFDEDHFEDDCYESSDPECDESRSEYDDSEEDDPYLHDSFYSEEGDDGYEDDYDYDYDTSEYLRRQLTDHDTSIIKQMKKRVSSGWKPLEYTECYDNISKKNVACPTLISLPSRIYTGRTEYVWKGRWTYPIDLLRAYLFTHDKSIPKIVSKAKLLQLQTFSKLPLKEAVDAEILLQALEFHYKKMSAQNNSKSVSSDLRFKRSEIIESSNVNDFSNDADPVRTTIEANRGSIQEQKQYRIQKYGVVDSIDLSQFDLKTIRNALAPSSTSRLPIPDETIEYQPANIEHPDTLLPFTVPGTLPDIKMRPLRIFLGLPNVYSLIDGHKPSSWNRQGPVLRQILRGVLRSRVPVARDPLVRAAAGDLLREWEAQRRRRKGAVRVEGGALEDALPLSCEKDDDSHAVERVRKMLFLEKPELVDKALSNMEIDLTVTKGRLLEKILQRLINLNELQGNEQLIKDLKEVSQLVVLDGLGAQSVPRLLPPPTRSRPADASRAHRRSLNPQRAGVVIVSGGGGNDYAPKRRHRKRKGRSKEAAWPEVVLPQGLRLQGDVLSATRMQLGTQRAERSLPMDRSEAQDER